MKRYQQIWYPGDTVSVGIGQGYSLVTPLQLAFATATLANNGVAYQPHLVKEVQSLRSSENRFIAKEPLYDLKIDPKDLDLVRRAMVAVTQPGGTAVYASLGAPYHIAGKTGTAQVAGSNSTSVFASFAPCANPKYVVVVMIPNSGQGADVSAPAVRQIWDAIYGLEGHRAALPGGNLPSPPKMNQAGQIVSASAALASTGTSSTGKAGTSTASTGPARTGKGGG